MVENTVNWRLARSGVRNLYFYPTGGNWAFTTAEASLNNLYVVGGAGGAHSKFSPEVEEAAWKLLEEVMTPGQYTAFMEGDIIEKESGCKKYRLLIEKVGKFSILEGGRGEGIVCARGNVRSGKYPMGDEIYTFMAWFESDPEELIGAWNCGNYSIKKDEFAGDAVTFIYDHTAPWELHDKGRQACEEVNAKNET